VDREWIAERAAILEYEAGFDRGLAERLAAGMWARLAENMPARAAQTRLESFSGQGAATAVAANAPNAP